MRCGQGFLLVFSLTEKNSYAIFFFFPKWSRYNNFASHIFSFHFGSISEIYRLHKQILRIKDNDNFPMILIGNKCDLQRQREVSNENIEEIRSQLRIPYLETSAKTRHNVEEAFYELVRQIKVFQMNERPPLNISKRESNKKKVNCCVL